MNAIPRQVLLGCALCAVCIVIAGTLRLASPDLAVAAQVIVILGLAGVTIETFHWGALRGYRILGQPFGMQVEHVVRCGVMSGIMILVSAFVGMPMLFAVFQAFFRRP